MLAFSIALWLDMPRPYWALASVYITSNQLTGATRSKALYRMLGTVIGAAGTVLLIPNLVNAPEILSLAIALWVGIFLYLSLIDGTPRSYMFMLSGYTVALLGFPVLAMPESTFDIVVARVQEIMLGITCASVVSTLVMSRSVASAIAAQTDAWLADARRLGSDVLTGQDGGEARDKERMRLAAMASEIDQLCRHLDYETNTSANAVRGLLRLRQCMLLLLPLLAAIEDRTLSLKSQGGMSAKLDEISARIARWLADGGRDGQEAAGLRGALDVIRPLGADAGWTEIMAAGLVVRLSNLMNVMQDCQMLREAIADGRDPTQLALVSTFETSGDVVSHRDHGLALWSAAATALSVLACCTFWIATGWTDGASAAIFAAVLGSLLAGVDDPLPVFRSFYWVFLAVIAVNGVYTFAVLPRITTFEMLIVALMPTLLLFGWLTARPATAPIGSFFAIFTSVQLALNSSYSADFISFANSSVALMIGVGLTGVICGIVRLFGSDWIAERLLRSGWKTLAAVAEAKSQQDRIAVASLMQHRLALLAARITLVPAEARSLAANFRLLRAALSIIDVRQASLSLSRAATADIDGLLSGVGVFGRARGSYRIPDELVGHIDDAIVSTLRDPASEHRNEVLIGLAGIRAGLFPEATPYEPHKHERRSIAA